ncbi:MAG: WD40 repeat domain-containing serine/threonine protein kinase [Planctomycetaceae bacterium]
MDERTIFLEVLEQDDVTQRAEVLNRACGDDLQLRGRVEALLRAHEDAGSFLERPPEEVNWTGHDMAAADSALDSAESWSGLLTPSDKPEVLGTLGSCEVIECIGRGGMGIVFRAHEPKLNRTVAIKLLAPELAANAAAVQRFVREARAAAAISHDNVVVIHAIDAEATPPMIVMGYVDGQSLQQKIDRVGALDVNSILRIGMQTAAGLAAAHRQGLVHRDIKPANILLENSIERVKVSDFGLARAVDAVDVTQTGQISGTPQYMSPEQAQAEAVDFRSDLFSLGCVLYAMCTGRAAFRADSALGVMHRIVHDRPRPIRNTHVDVPAWLCAIIDKLLEKDPAQRYQSADEVAELLGRHLAHLQQPDAVPQPERLAVATLEETAMGLDAANAHPASRSAGWSVRKVLLTVASVILALFGSRLLVGVLTSTQPSPFSSTNHQGLLEEPNRRIWLAKTWDDTGQPVLDIDISPDGRWVVSGHRAAEERGGVRLWSVDDGRLSQTVPLPSGVSVFDVAFSPDGRYFAWVQDDGHLRLQPTSPSDAPAEELRPFDPVEIPLKSLAWSPDGATILTGGQGPNPLSEWDVRLGGSPVSIPWGSPTGTISAIAFSPAGTRFATASGVVSVWRNDVQPAQIIRSISTSDFQLYDIKSEVFLSVAFSSDGKSVYAGHQFGGVYSQEIASGKGQLLMGGSASNTIGLSPDGSVMAVVGFSNEFLRPTLITGILDDDWNVWNEDSDDTPGETLSWNPRSELTSVVFTPNGRYLIGGSRDGTIKTWELQRPVSVRPAAASSAQVPDVKGLVESRILKREFDVLFQGFSRGPDWGVPDSENRTANDQDVIAVYRVVSPGFLRVSAQQELSYRGGRFNDADARLRIAKTIETLNDFGVDLSKVAAHLLEQSQSDALSGARLQLAIQILEVEVRKLTKNLE